MLVVNHGFAQANPKMVAGLVDGLLEGNRMVRDNAAAHLDVIGKAFKWDRAQTQAELAKVHLSNLPENLAFFRGDIDAAGSFGGIYQSAVYAYGRELIPEPRRPSGSSTCRTWRRSTRPARSRTRRSRSPRCAPAGDVAVEDNPLLSKDIRFFFKPNSAELDMANKENLDNLDSIKELLQVSPGSTILLRGHVDNAAGRVPRRRATPFVRQMALKAVQLSKDRADEVEKRLAERSNVDAARVEVVGRGWDEPVSPNSDENRRVEVQWFLVE